jgi:hypothetical protein
VVDFVDFHGHVGDGALQPKACAQGLMPAYSMHMNLYVSMPVCVSILDFMSTQPTTCSCPCEGTCKAQFTCFSGPDVFVQFYTHVCICISTHIITLNTYSNTLSTSTHINTCKHRISCTYTYAYAPVHKCRRRLGIRGFNGGHGTGKQRRAHLVDKSLPPAASHKTPISVQEHVCVCVCVCFVKNTCTFFQSCVVIVHPYVRSCARAFERL